MMKRITALLASLLLVVGSSAAAPVTFKCTTAEGDPAADLVVDIENRTMVWATHQLYTIHAVDDRYISAYLKNQSQVGGEVWVLNRTTGEYLRVDVTITWLSAEAARSMRSPGKLSAGTYRGRCSRPLL